MLLRLRETLHLKQQCFDSHFVATFWNLILSSFSHKIEISSFSANCFFVGKLSSFHTLGQNSFFCWVFMNNEKLKKDLKLICLFSLHKFSRLVIYELKKCWCVLNFLCQFFLSLFVTITVQSSNYLFFKRLKFDPHFCQKSG